MFCSCDCRMRACIASSGPHPTVVMMIPLACSIEAREGIACSRFSLNVRASQYACTLATRNAAGDVIREEQPVILGDADLASVDAARRITGPGHHNRPTMGRM